MIVSAVPVNSHGAASPSVTRTPSRKDSAPSEVRAWLHAHAAKKTSGGHTTTERSPLAFLAGSVLAQLITAADAFAAATGILITLGTSAPWLFTGTGLTMAIALGRGWRPELATSMLANLRAALRDIRPRGDRWVDRR